MMWRLTILLMILLSGCDFTGQDRYVQERVRIAFEDGVFWGSEATRQGGTRDTVLLRAYALREAAQREVQKEKEALKPYREKR